MCVSVCLACVGVWPSGPVAVDKVRTLPNRVLLSATRPVCQIRCFVRRRVLLPAVMAGFEVISAQSSPCPQDSRQGPVTLHLIRWIMASLSDTFLVAQLYLNCPFLPWKALSELMAAVAAWLCRNAQRSWRTCPDCTFGTPAVDRI